jgi:glutamate/aspartate transport system substrate-binding protein
MHGARVTGWGMHRAVVCALTIVMVLLPFATATPAAEPGGTLKKIKERKTIALGHRESSWPFSFVDDNGKPAGYSVDLCVKIAEAIEKDLGLSSLAVQWVKLTPENRIKAVADGQVDLECGSTTATLSRQQQVDFTITTFVDGGSLLATDASAVEGVRDLAGKRVAIVPGTTTEATLATVLKQYVITPQMVTVKDHAEGLAALENGKADVYASDRVILIGLGRRSAQRSKLSLSPQLFSYEPYGLMLRRGDADFRLAANRALSRLYRSQDIVRIYEKWFGDMGKPSAALILMYAITAVPE